MKKLFLILFCLLFAVSMSACTPVTEPPPEISPVDYFNFSELDWGMTQQEALQALGLTEQDVTWSDESEEPNPDIQGFVYTPKEEVFGAVPYQIACLFTEVPNHDEYVLVYIRIFYHEEDEAHVQTVKDALIQEYGPLEDQVVTHVSPSEGSRPPSLSTHNNKTNEDYFVWQGKKTLEEVLTDRQKEKSRQEYQETDSPWDEESWQLLLQNTFLSTIKLDARSGGEVFSLEFDGGNACYAKTP